MYIKESQFVSVIYRNHWDTDPNLLQSIYSAAYRFTQTMSKTEKNNLRATSHLQLCR